MERLTKMLSKRKRGKGGFTLIELMIVVIIVGILAAAAVPVYTSFVKKAYKSEAQASLGAIKTAEEVYFAEYNKYAVDATVPLDGAWDELGMTSTDFLHNTWFDEKCFYLVSNETSFTAYCDGDLADDETVHGIRISIDQNGVFGTFIEGGALGTPVEPLGT